VSAPDLFRLDGSVALVIGGAGGLGRAMARGLAEAGAAVAVADVEAGAAGEVASAIGRAGSKAWSAAVDVTARADVVELVDAVVAERGSVDAFVANAGVMPLSRLDAGLVDEWDRMIDVNIRGLLHGIHAVLPHFRRRGAGHLVTVASIGAHEVSPTAAVYCGTKFAAWAITEGLRLESDSGIRVTTVSPGVVESELADTITDPTAAELMRTYRRAAIPPSAIGDAIAYALSQPAEVDVNEIVVRPVRQR
jgi:NADP-dependent 3-hydroxy acid dehydrogenase YdfG